MGTKFTFPNSETGVTLYALIFNSAGQVADVAVSSAMETYATADLGDYDVALTELGTASRIYQFTVPSFLTAGDYFAAIFKRAGASPAEGDLRVGVGSFGWNGTAIIAVGQLADAVSHGGTTATLRLGSTDSDPAFYATNSGGNAVTFEATGGDGIGLYVQGNGSGAGLSATGGNGGHGILAAGVGSGHGFRALGGATDGSGIHAQGQAAGDGIEAVAGGTGVDIRGGITGSVTGNLSGSVGSVAAGGIAAASFAAGAINAAAIAPDAIGASELAADAIAEIADAVWDEDATAHQTGGTFGQAIGDPGADTNTIFGAVVTDATGATVGADTTTLISRVGSPSNLGSGATVAANLVDIESQTDDIGVAGAGLTAIPWSSAWDAEIQSEVEDALAAYHVVLVKTTIATLASQTSFTLTAGSADNDAYNGCEIVIEDASTAAQKAVGVVADYTGSTKTITLLNDPAVFTMAATDIVTIRASRSLKATVDNRTLDVTATGAAGVDWANVENQSTAVNLSSTNIDTDQVVASVTGAVGSVTGNVGGNVVGSVGSVAAGGITAASFAAGAIDASAIAADAIGSSELAASAASEIATAVRTELATELARVDVAVSTRLIGTTTGSGFTAIPWNSAWDTEVQSEVDDALVAHRLDELLNADSDIDGAAPPTVGSVFHELMTKTAGSFTYDQTTDSLEAIRDRGDAAWITSTFSITAGAIADAVWDEATTGHTTSGTFGEQLKTDVDAILADTGTDGVLLATGSITAAVIATDAIDSDAIAASAVTEIQSGLSTLTAAQVNAEVVDALATDTYAEPASVPAATSSLKDKISWVFTLARNKITETATTQTLRNDADSASVGTATVSDDGTTFVRAEWQ